MTSSTLDSEIKTAEKISKYLSKGLLYFFLAIFFSIAALTIMLLGDHIPDMSEGWSRNGAILLNFGIAIASLIYGSYSFEKLALIYYEAITKKDT